MDLLQAERQLKRFGYFHGPTLIDMLTGLVFDEHGEFRPAAPDLGTAEGLMAARLRLLIELDKPTLSLPKLLGLWETAKRLTEIEQLAKRQTLEPANVLIDIALAEDRLGPAPAAAGDAEDQPEEAAVAEEAGRAVMIA